jgi:PAS domain S-box-containing protein
MPVKLFHGGPRSESPMDRLVKAVCEAFSAPIGLVSIYDEGELHRPIVGLDGVAIPMEFNLARTMMGQGPGAVMVVSRTSDARIRNHPFVTGPLGLKFLAAATICDRSGAPVGSIGVMDSTPRDDLSETQRTSLKRFAVMAGDLVELERAERESVAKRRTLELAEAMAGVGHLHVDIASGAVSWSDEVFRIYGYEPGAVEPSMINALAACHPEDAKLLLSLTDTAKRTGEGYDARIRLVRADGEERVMRTTVRCERDGDGAVTAVFGVFQDITDMVRAQQTLIEARDLAEAHSQAKSDFLANMSHELRTPLTSVIGFSSFLALSQGLSDKERHYVDRISVASRSLLGVINDVLDYSKLEAGSIDLDRAPFNPRAWAETAAALIEEQCDKAGLVLDITIADAVPETLIGDEGHLRQVVVNFLANAVKFTSAGRIALSLDMRGPNLRVSVKDSGIGIAPDAIDRLFDRFTQGNASTTRLYGGTGLGLAISRRLVDLMDGRIGADSEVGAGSTFWFEVPLETPEEQRADPAPVRILLADDSAATRSLVAAILGSLDFHVDVVGNGAEAVNAALCARYDAILMDVNMPVLDGVEAARTIHAMQASGARTPIIALTAAVQAEQIQRYFEAGMVGHVAKPVRPDQLIGELGWALSRSPGSPGVSGEPGEQRVAA